MKITRNMLGDIERMAQDKEFMRGIADSGTATAILAIANPNLGLDQGRFSPLLLMRVGCELNRWLQTETGRKGSQAKTVDEAAGRAAILREHISDYFHQGYTGAELLTATAAAIRYYTEFLHDQAANHTDDEELIENVKKSGLWIAEQIEQNGKQIASLETLAMTEKPVVNWQDRWLTVDRQLSEMADVLDGTGTAKELQAVRADISALIADLTA